MRTKRMRIIIEVDTQLTRKQFNAYVLRETEKTFPAPVYLATEEADENETARGHRSWVEPLVIKP